MTAVTEAQSMIKALPNVQQALIFTGEEPPHVKAFELLNWDTYRWMYKAKLNISKWINMLLNYFHKAWRNKNLTIYLPNKINELGLKTALELIHIILPASIHPIKIPIIICLIIQVKNGFPSSITLFLCVRHLLVKNCQTQKTLQTVMKISHHFTAALMVISRIIHHTTWKIRSPENNNVAGCLMNEH